MALGKWAGGSDGFKFMGATQKQVEFMLKGRRVVAWSDGEVDVHDDETGKTLPATPEETKMAKTLIAKHLKKPTEFKGRAMSGRGVSS